MFFYYNFLDMLHKLLRNTLIWWIYLCWNFNVHDFYWPFVNWHYSIENLFQLEKLALESFSTTDIMILRNVENLKLVC